MGKKRVFLSVKDESKNHLLMLLIFLPGNQNVLNQTEALKVDNEINNLKKIFTKAK